MISPNYTTDYFNIGNEVIYVPKDAEIEFAEWLQRDAPDWIFKYSRFQKGIVSSVNGKFVFVKYLINGDPQIFQGTAQATNPQDLLLWKK
jgi:hypothetical protein